LFWAIQFKYLVVSRLVVFVLASVLSSTDAGDQGEGDGDNDKDAHGSIRALVLSETTPPMNEPPKNAGRTLKYAPHELLGQSLNAIPCSTLPSQIVGQLASCSSWIFSKVAISFFLSNAKRASIFERQQCVSRLAFSMFLFNPIVLRHRPLK
jgi:hypothetical protein